MSNNGTSFLLSVDILCVIVELEKKRGVEYEGQS